MKGLGETHQLETQTGDPPQPSLKEKTHPNPPCLGRELLLSQMDIIPVSEVFAPSLNREGWGGSLVVGLQQSNLLCTSKYHQTEGKVSSVEEQTNLLCSRSDYPCNLET